jgi:hypothetical protein
MIYLLIALLFTIAGIVWMGGLIWKDLVEFFDRFGT